MAEEGSGLKTCRYSFRYSEPCGRPLFDREHCIFHSKKIEEKKDEFREKFFEEFFRQEKNEKKYDFSGFVFTGGINFSGFEFKIDVNFPEATFTRIADFRGATFRGEADFGIAKFPGDADFWQATFSGDTYFTGAKFSGEADFERATFSGEAYFGEATFSGEVSFRGATFSKKVDFWDATFSGPNLTGLFDSLKNKGFSRLKGRFKIKDFLFNVGPEIAKKYPVIDRMTKDAWYLANYKSNYPIIYWLWNVTAKCGQSIWRWSTWSLFFAFYFAVNFLLIDYSFTDAFKFNSPLIDKSFLSYVYYSVVTFTTLGFGDITPIISTAQKWVMAEVITGYVMLGGLISILANKLARRS